MKVLYAVSEALPFIASGGLADVAGSLPRALKKRRVDCRVILPLYAGIDAKARAAMRFITDITVPVAWRRQYCGIFEAEADGVTYYLLDNEYYFKRDSLYGHYDDGERFAFFSRAVLEVLAHLDFKPDIVHCNDWQTALIPIYRTTLYAHTPGFENLKTVLTIHNIQYQGVYGRELLGDVLGLTQEDYSLLENDGAVNLMKGGIECADMVTTVSPTYADEILDPWFSHGLDSILRLRSYKLRGILNGIDEDRYNPETDTHIAAKYSADNPKNKSKNKAALQTVFGLPVTQTPLLCGMVTRLVAHKGLDLVRDAAEDLLANDAVQLAVLGSGDAEYEQFFEYLAQKYPQAVGFKKGFLPELARNVYAGSDAFIMPSKSEPCGLAQMVALRYGSIPIVRETGGLKDSVSDSGDGFGTGFTFKGYDAGELAGAVRRAIQGYSDKNGWAQLVERAMRCDNSWRASAGEYITMYKDLIR